jgi:hypothetical protein
MNKISIGSELTDLQFNVRNAYMMIGANCLRNDDTPSIRSYETPNSYRLRILKDIKRRSKMFKDTDLDTLTEKQLINVFDRALEALRAFAYIPEKDFHFEERMNFWRYNEELTVIQAALLCVNEDPAQLQNDILKAHYSYQPMGFNAVFSALTEAILAKRLNATLRYDTE